MKWSTDGWRLLLTKKQTSRCIINEPVWRCFSQNITSSYIIPQDEWDWKRILYVRKKNATQTVNMEIQVAPTFLNI
jgi:hypothetical protein